jgi:hydrogenase expression/formation protein HypC
MCLGIPGQVVEMVEGYGDQLVLVDVAGGRSRVNLGMLEDPEVSPGDWLLIHMGFAIERIDEEAADRAMAGLEMMGRSRDDSGQPHGAPFEAQLRPGGL